MIKFRNRNRNTNQNRDNATWSFDSSTGDYIEWQSDNDFANEMTNAAFVHLYNVEYEKAKSEFEKDRMQLQAQLDQQKMMMQHKNDMELKKVEVEGMSAKEKLIEDRKDKRSKMEATQQSEMISQRKNDSLPINFENENVEMDTTDMLPSL